MNPDKTFMGGLTLDDLRDLADIAGKYPVSLPRGEVATLAREYRRTTGAIGQVVSQLRHLHRGEPVKHGSLAAITSEEIAYILRCPETPPPAVDTPSDGEIIEAIKTIGTACRALDQSGRSFDDAFGGLSPEEEAAILGPVDAPEPGDAALLLTIVQELRGLRAYLEAVWGAPK